MASVTTVGLQLLGSLAKLLGARVASALFVSASGRVLLRILVHTVGGPFAFLPTTMLSTAVNSVVPSPLVLIQGVRAGVRVAYVLMETPILKGARRLLVSLRDARFVAPGLEQRAQWLSSRHVDPIDDYRPVHQRIVISDNSNSLHSALSSSGEHQPIMRADAPLILDLDDHDLQVVDEYFDGDRVEVNVDDLPDLLRKHGRQDESALCISRIAAGSDSLQVESWQPADLLVQSRSGQVDSMPVVSASVDYFSRSDSELGEKSSTDDDWVPLDSLV